MKGDRNRSASERLNAKTLDQMFVNMVEQGYECPPFVSNAILETAKSVFIPRLARVAHEAWDQGVRLRRRTSQQSS